MDEKVLCEKIRLGDDKAMHQLVSQNLKFVVSVAKQYIHTGVPIMDLINEGNMGLIIAAQRFDSTRGIKFISYGVWWIRQSIMNFITEKGGIVRLPLNKRQALKGLHKMISDKEQELSFELSLNDAVIMFDLDVSDSLYHILESGGKKALSLDLEYGTGEEAYTLKESLILSDDSFRADLDIDAHDLKMMIGKCLEYLPIEKRYIITKFYGFGCEKMEFNTIADELGCSGQKVRNYHKLALHKMKRIYLSLSKEKKTNTAIPSISFNPERYERIKNAKPITSQEVRDESYRNFMETSTNIKVISIKSTIVKQETIIKVNDEIILDHFYGRFTGVKGSIASVAKLLGISKADVYSAVNKYKRGLKVIN